MGFPRLDPYNHLIRKLQRATSIPEEDKNHVLSIVFAYKNLPAIPVHKATIVCAALFAYAQVLRIQNQMDACDLSSTKYRELTWNYSKHVENYKKAFAIIGKIDGPKRVSRVVRPDGVRSAASLIEDTGATRTGLVAYPNNQGDAELEG